VECCAVFVPQEQYEFALAAIAQEVHALLLPWVTSCSVNDVLVTVWCWIPLHKWCRYKLCDEAGLLILGIQQSQFLTRMPSFFSVSRSLIFQSSLLRH